MNSEVVSLSQFIPVLKLQNSVHLVVECPHIYKNETDEKRKPEISFSRKKWAYTFCFMQK